MCNVQMKDVFYQHTRNAEVSSGAQILIIAWILLNTMLLLQATVPRILITTSQGSVKLNESRMNILFIHPHPPKNINQSSYQLSQTVNPRNQLLKNLFNKEDPNISLFFVLRSVRLWMKQEIAYCLEISKKLHLESVHERMQTLYVCLVLDSVSW